MALTAPLIVQFADVLLKDLRPGDWITLRDGISGAAKALQQIRDTRDATVTPDNSLPSIIAVAIEKLGSPEIEDALQAFIWKLSGFPGHRALGEAWLHAHPTEREALEREVADDHFAFILRGGSVHAETDHMLPPLPPRQVMFRAIRDEEAGVWSATSDDHITAEAPSREELLDRLKVIVPDLLESRAGRIGPLTLVVDWQELRTIDQSTLAIA